jgi:serine/threonine-protein kinase
VLVGTGAGNAIGSSPGVKPGVVTALLRKLAAAPEAQGEGAWGPAPRPGDVLGRFELLRELGRGGFGVVWEARDQELGRKVAFKLVRAGHAEGGADQLHREAEAVARLQHPNLVTLHDVGHCEHGPYLVLELLRGETLQARLSRGPLPLEEALAVAVEVARGLAHAHAEGVVHRDLKPSNVFLCARGGVKLLDFGMAHAFGRKRVSGGTPAYMAPEQWRDEPEDERTDVFALGVMLYQMLTGTLPFPDDGGRSVRGPEPAPRLQVPGAPALGPLVARMLAKDLAERSRDGGSALVELERIAAERPPDDPGSTNAVVVRRSRRWRGLVAATIAVAAATALGAAALFLARRPPAPPGPPSVAVLPFADLSPGKDQEYLSDGIAEELLNALSRVEGLKVAGHTSSFSFKGKGEDAAAIAGKLHVAHLLEGSVRKDGNRVRISAQLVSARDGFNLWSETFDRELTGVFAIQDEIARAVVDALKVKLLPGREPARADRRPANPEAYEQVLLGRDYIRRGNIERNLRLSAEAYQKALALDSGYAPAWAGLSEALYGLANRAGTPAGRAEGLRRSLSAAEKAIELDPGLPAGYLARAESRRVGAWDFAGAEADMERALALGPADARAQRAHGYVLLENGRAREGLSSFRKAIELDPLDGETWFGLAAAHLELGDKASARTALERAREVTPDTPLVGFALGQLSLLEGKPVAALSVFEQEPVESWRTLGAALARHTLGQTAAAQEALDELVASDRQTRDWAYQVAQVHAWRGDREAAIEWLERAYRQRDGGLMWLKADPLLRPLRGDPRFQALLRKVNLPVD